MKQYKRIDIWKDEQLKSQVSTINQGTYDNDIKSFKVAGYNNINNLWFYTGKRMIEYIALGTK